MSGQAILYLGWIGLLGEYCPFLLERVGCMHRVPFQEYPEFSGCSRAQPSFTAADLSFHAQEGHLPTSIISFL